MSTLDEKMERQRQSGDNVARASLDSLRKRSGHHECAGTPGDPVEYRIETPTGGTERWVREAKGRYALAEKTEAVYRPELPGLWS